MESSGIKRMKKHEEENRQLKSTFTEPCPEHCILTDVIEKAVKPTIR
ncbi:TPA: hypothetical protein ACX6RK_001834 [Photobacterium damselae]